MLSGKKIALYKKQCSEALNMAHTGEPCMPHPPTPQHVLGARLLPRGSVGRLPMSTQPRMAVSMVSPMSHDTKSVSSWMDVTSNREAPWGNRKTYFPSTLPGLKQAGAAPRCSRIGVLSGRHSLVWGTSSPFGWKKEGTLAPGTEPEEPISDQRGRRARRCLMPLLQGHHSLRRRLFSLTQLPRPPPSH